MKTLLTVSVWTVLFLLCWPLALLILVLWPVLWLLSIPFRVLGGAVNGILALVSAIFLLPARILGHR
jgi:hypothetical protein